MRFFVLLTLTLLLTACAKHPHSPPPESVPLPALMPYPAELKQQAGVLTLADGLRLETAPDHPILAAALTRFEARLERQRGLRLLRDTSIKVPGLSLDIARQTGSGLNSADEAYRLIIDAQGIQLHATTELGALHGLETLLQLIGTGPKDSTQLPYLTINDQPRFAWRGLLIDSARHFFSLPTLKRQIDGMAAAKLNVFHWHLTDDQGWRLESARYPKLHQIASDGLYYTQAEIRELVAYAQARGIYVLPEIDMPGHASAIARAYPELMSAPGPYGAEDRWGVHRPLLNPANPEVLSFAQGILTEVAELFPFGYVHIGGDEVDPTHWEQNDAIQAFMAERQLSDSAELHAWFNAQLTKILAGLNRVMVGWDETLHPDLPADTVVQSWQGPDALARAVNQGHPALLSTGFYLDQPQYAAYHYRNRLIPDAPTLDTQPGTDETWQSWSFSFARKRGSAISGRITLIENPAGEHRGFIDFAGKSRQTLNDVTRTGDWLRFSVDTWMGPVSAELMLEHHQLTGRFTVGNAPYFPTGKLIAGSLLPGTTLAPPYADKALIAPGQIDRVLGGEAALWSEMVNEQSIDNRLWPRAFVVAERLWSPADTHDIHDMYQRLDAIDRWSEISVGLQHKAQQEAGLMRLFGQQNLAVARTFTSALEPAHYYHRHHEKSAHETYSRRDPLDRLADSLPAESTGVRRFNQAVDDWLKRGDTGAEATIKQQLEQWQNAANTLLKNQQYPALARSLIDLSTLGLHLMTPDKKALHKQDIQQSQTLLANARMIQEEIIVAPVFGVERLFNAWVKTSNPLNNAEQNP